MKIRELREMVICEHDCSKCPDKHLCPLAYMEKRRAERRAMTIANLMKDEDIIQLVENGDDESLKTAEIILDSRVV